MVGLETELSLKWRHHSALNTGLAWERSSTQLGLDEELTVEKLGRGIEWRARDGRINVVLSSDGVTTNYISHF